MNNRNTFLVLFLLPFAGLYWLITKLRNWWYDRCLLSVHSVDVPVISVGNITAGGTGKTPFVIALAKRLIQLGYAPGIVSRGYKRQSNGQQLVRDRDSIVSAKDIAGDEALMIAAMVERSVVIVDRNRIAAARTAVHKHQCDIIIADDAFQHRRLGRDIDIVLWDAAAHPLKSKVLPAGRLRESIRELRRADLLCVTRTDSIPVQYLDYFKNIKSTMTIEPLPMIVDQISRYATGEKISASTLNSRRVLAFCGLGNPSQFFTTVKRLTDTVPETETFPDHHAYSEKDITMLTDSATCKGCDYLITTRKDAVNLPKTAARFSELLIVDIRYELTKKIEAAIFQKLPPPD